MELINFIFSGFWVFIGSLILISLIVRAFIVTILGILRYFIINKHGYPSNDFNDDLNNNIEI